MAAQHAESCDWRATAFLSFERTDSYAGSPSASTGGRRARSRGSDQAGRGLSQMGERCARERVCERPGPYRLRGDP